jgi:hypothetical protein
MTAHLSPTEQRLSHSASRPPNCKRAWGLFVAILSVALTCLLPATVYAEPSDPVTGTVVADPVELQDVTTARRVLLPLVQGGQAEPITGASYATIPVEWPPTDRPAASHGDLNLALRGYKLTTAPLSLVDYSGDTDAGAPQMRGIFSDNRTPNFTSAYQVYDWNWACGQDGCRGSLLNTYPVTLLGMATRAGELLAAPSRGAEIYPGGYTALVLYAEPTRITLKYTRNDNVVSGYTLHFERLNVDAKLLALYQQANAAGRSQLPALKNGQPLGLAAGGEVLVAIRDWGTFMDPRSRKDWWQ